MPYPLHPKPHLSSPKKMWSFGHLVILPFCMLDYWICRSLMKRNRSFDEKKNRAGGNEK